MRLTLIINLFEIFDPSTRNNLSINWLFIILPITIFPRIFWSIQSRIIFIIKTLINFIFPRRKYSFGKNGVLKNFSPPRLKMFSFPDDTAF